jgi:aspartate/methionine/tyrosine aminotransferase
MVNPNNPTGSFVSADEFDVVTNLCRNHDLALIVDEVFVTYPMATRAMRMSVLRRTPEVLTFSLGGLSKAVGLPQIKLGWITVGGPLVVVEQALSRLELICDTYLSVGTPGQIASPQLFRVGAVVADRIRTRLRANYGKLRQLVRGYQSVQLLAIDGGWYAVLQVPTTQSEEELVLALLERDRVLVHPGYFFDFPREAFLIISLLQKPHVFELGVKKLLARVAGTEGETINR